MSKSYSLVMFDRGANDKENLENIGMDWNKYPTAKKLNKSNDQDLAEFSIDALECIEVMNCH